MSSLKRGFLAFGSLAALLGGIFLSVSAIDNPAWATDCTGLPFTANCKLTASSLNGAFATKYTVGGALGTPSSGNATNLTGLPLANIAGLGSGVATALAIAHDTAGGICTVGGTGCPAGGGGWGAIGSSVITGGTTGRFLYDNAGVLGEAVIGSGLSFSGGTLSAPGGGGWGVVGTSVITSGVSGRLLYDNAGLLGELALGTGVSTWLGSPSAANFAAAMAGAVTVPTGGTGVTSITANALLKGNGASPFSASALSDDGTKISATEPVDLTTKPLEVEIANAGSTGTTLNKLAKMTGAPATAVIAAITDADGAIGIVNGGAGTTSNARIAVSGQANCVFDGATTAGDFVTISPTIAGDCRDIGSTRPSATQTIGRVLTTNGAGGTYAVLLDRNFTNSGVVTGAGVNNGTNTPATVTTSGVTGATVNREVIGALAASITRTLPAIGSAGLASDATICYDDLAANVSVTRTLTILPNAADGINGGSVGVGVGPWTSLTENCFRVAGTHNWAQSDGVPTSNAPAGSVATSLGINGLGYDPLSTVMDSALGNTQGSIIYRNGTVWTVLGPGTVGQVLQTGGAAANPSWATSASNIPVNAQTGTTYTVVTGDQGKLVTTSNGSAIAVTLPQAGTAGFAAQWGTRVTNLGAGTATITPTTSTFNGAATIVLTTGMSALIVSDGTNYEGAISVPSSGGGSSTAAIPQGRLTCTTGVPVMTADVASCTTVYYDSFNGNVYPNWSGSAMANITITSDEISMGLDAGSHIVSGSVYDVFGTAAGTICAGPAWSSTTARGTGAGTTELQLKNGVWTNKVSITNCWGGAAGVTDRGAIAANQGTYLGSFYATANGTTKVTGLDTAVASGGNNSCMCLANPFNRTQFRLKTRDSSGNYAYASATWSVANPSGTGSGLNNRISWIDPLGGTSVGTEYSDIIESNVAGVATQGNIGVTFDSTTTTPAGILATWWPGTLNPNGQGVVTTTSKAAFAGALGLHYAQEMISSTGGGSVLYGGNGYQGMFASMSN